MIRSHVRATACVGQALISQEKKRQRRGNRRTGRGEEGRTEENHTASAVTVGKNMTPDKIVACSQADVVRRHVQKIRLKSYDKQSER